MDPAVDVIVVTRGGGADTDLWCFNAGPVVRAIADTTTPVVDAIGHDRQAFLQTSHTNSAWSSHNVPQCSQTVSS